ncbi:MAG: sulfatase-like hydrolase/transferase [Candidatus Aminicenantes bacterium]|nr:sulfatase-like hydrolase/transferase [Candidatus Aminicenantes bacterium]NIM82014.1 sulfatase-like hydrolase/transferase [Candidatus Aminicenantes bacterium]NIN22344.1 sulfatase-like hydrolase/transferase [Candidatus Aminicenantes bacterium]NIN45225.1 sulfatase-like hydrolase/transferase [Candidatus Aminicenantes bacterium]NIN88045.1 sulfatase-like hydrolase/transferase [Candidatus Aminicenantes bacterium]
MIRKNRLIKGLFFLLISMILFGFNGDAKPDLRNIIIISVDTLRADHLSCYGYPLETSPAVDAFARDGVLFTNCYALTPLTTPSFGTMLTSLPPFKHGAKRNGLSLYRKVKTLPYYLKRLGYRTAAFVSNWPLRKKLCGFHKDFDAYYQVFTKKRWLGILNSEGEAPEVTQKAITWLKKNRERRFFLWVLYTEPHGPYILHKNFTFDYSRVPPSTYPPGTKMKRIKRYDSEIAFTDHYIGKLIEKIKQLGLYRNSLIVFTGDHWESFGEHNYSRHGRRLYNSTLHVPLIIKLPGNRLKNTVRHENASILDIGPTIFSTLNFPGSFPMDGINLFNRDSSMLNREILLEAYGGTVHLRRKDKKYHMKVKPIRYAILDGSVKMIYNLKSNSFEAYDIKSDPFETINIFYKFLTSAGDLKQVLLGKVDEVKKYIKLNLNLRFREAVLSKDDIERLKSLGYMD